MLTTWFGLALIDVKIKSFHCSNDRWIHLNSGYEKRKLKEVEHPRQSKKEMIKAKSRIVRESKSVDYKIKACFWPFFDKKIVCIPKGVKGKISREFQSFLHRKKDFYYFESTLNIPQFQRFAHEQ